jgi:hypothetical protein
MIIVLFGQPGCGKTTLARKVVDDITWNIDGDELRSLFKNTDYSRKGRLQNLNRASDIAHYMESLGSDIVVSLVYPYKEARNYLNNLNTNVKWVYLTYEGQRGREDFHVKDFEIPVDEPILHLDTSKLSITQCLATIKSYVNEELPSESAK